MADCESFSVDINDLKDLTIESGWYIYNIHFNFLNGSSAFFGKAKNNYFKNTINLVDQKITSLFIRSGAWINALQFQLFDKHKEVEMLTEEFGMYGGDQYNVTSSPNSEFFEITRLIGTVDQECIRTLFVITKEHICQ